MITDEIAQYLDEQGIGIYDPDGITSTIFVENMPDQPDVAICIYSSAGQSPDTKTNVGRPGVQTITRGDRDPRTASALAKLVHDALHVPDIQTFTSEGRGIILCAARQSEPVSLGPDENGRYEFSDNFQLITK